MEKKKLVYIISNINKSLAFEWLVDSDLLKDHFEVSFVLLNSVPGHLYQHLIDKGVRVKFVPYAGKRDLLKAIYRIYQFLKNNNVRVVHTHMLDANLAGLIAAKAANVPVRIYTRHHSAEHHVYHPKGVYYDKLSNFLSTRIIAISSNVQRILHQMEGVHLNKIRMIHHGLYLNEFNDVSKERIDSVVSRHQLPATAFPKIGVVARYVHLKGIQFIIPAFKKILAEYPDAHLILANATGDFKNEIDRYLLEVPFHTYTQIKFEHDIPALYKSFDVYVHTPVDEISEAFGLTYVEALASGTPSVFSLSGVAADFIINERNALVVPFQNSDAIVEAVKRLLKEDLLRQSIIDNGIRDVRENFQFDQMIKKLIDVYTE